MIQKEKTHFNYEFFFKNILFCIMAIIIFVVFFVVLCVDIDHPYRTTTLIEGKIVCPDREIEHAPLKLYELRLHSPSVSSIMFSGGGGFGGVSFPAMQAALVFLFIVYMLLLILSLILYGDRRKTSKVFLLLK